MKGNSIKEKMKGMRDLEGIAEKKAESVVPQDDCWTNRDDWDNQKKKEIKVTDSESQCIVMTRKLQV